MKGCADQPVQELEDRRRRYAQLSALLDEWAAEPEGFDFRVGPMIEQILEERMARTKTWVWAQELERCARLARGGS